MWYSRGHQLSMSSVKTRKACSGSVFTVMFLRTGVSVVGAIVAILPPLLGFLRLLLEGGECLCPESFEELAQRIESPGVERVDPPVSLGPVGDQHGLLQDAQVLGDRGPADRESLGQLPHRQRPAHQPVQDG